MKKDIYPSYLTLKDEEFDSRIARAKALVPPQDLVIHGYLRSLHEETPLVSGKGSGVIFFSFCNMHCVYCLNSDISQNGVGSLETVGNLAHIMLELSMQCNNIHLESPSHVIPHILEAVKLARSVGMEVPLVYNTGGYDSVEMLKLLDGIVDIYVPDMKYSDAAIAKKFSGVDNYPEINQKAVTEMFRQVGDLEVVDGIARKGLLVRHLVLPNDLGGSEGVINFIANLSKNTYLNLIPKYHPEYKAFEIPELARPITHKEYNTVLKLARKAGLNRIDSEKIPFDKKKE